MPYRRVLLAHGMRNAMLPVLSLVGLRVGGLLAGTVLVESVFAVPGVGRMMADAVVARDFPMVQGGVLVVAAMVVVVNGVTDVVGRPARPAGARVSDMWTRLAPRHAGRSARSAVLALVAVGGGRSGPWLTPYDPVAVDLAVELPAEFRSRIRSAPTTSAATP